MPSGFIDSPVYGVERLFINDAQLGHDAQGIADTDAEGVTADSCRTHDQKCIHDFCDASKGWIARIQWRVERLTRRGNDILVKTEPVDVGTTDGPSLAIEHQRGVTASDIRVRYETDRGGLHG